MTPIIDMGEVEEFEPVDDGWYDAALSDWEYNEESQSSGEPFIKLEFAIEEGDFANRKLFKNHSLQSKALWAFKRTLTSLGADSDVISGQFDLDEVMPDLVGNSVRLKVGTRTYEGREVNEIERIVPSSVTV